MLLFYKMNIFHFHPYLSKLVNASRDFNAPSSSAKFTETFHNRVIREKCCHLALCSNSITCWFYMHLVNIIHQKPLRQTNSNLVWLIEVGINGERKLLLYCSHQNHKQCHKIIEFLAGNFPMSFRWKFISNFFSKFWIMINV